MAKRADKQAKYKQFAALPWCLNDEGEVEILILTTRDSRQWMLSKGKGEGPVTGAAIAAMEAEEEAGVRGETSAKPVGGFWYDKHTSSGKVMRCFVEIYPMRATEQLLDWKEKGQRDIVWATPEIAVARLLANTNIPEKKRNKEKLARIVMREVRKIYRDELDRKPPPSLHMPARPKKKMAKKPETEAVPK